MLAYTEKNHCILFIPFQSLIRGTGDDELHNTRVNPDNRRQRSKKRKHHRNSPSTRPLLFSEKLAAAVIGDPKKVGPLYTERSVKGSKKPKPIVRIRALQHMVVLYLRREIAGEVAEIVDTKSADPEVMEKSRKTMKQYGRSIPFSSI